MKGLEKFLLTTGIIISSLAPIKSQAQERYMKLGGSGKSISSSFMEDNFKTVPGIKFDIGKQTNERGRVEIGVGYFKEKSKEIKAETKMYQGELYYDLILGSKEAAFYFGAGAKLLNFNLKNTESNYKEKLTGVGYGVRVGIEIKGKKGNSVFYLEGSYDEISGKHDGEDYDLSGTDITLGIIF